MTTLVNITRTEFGAERTKCSCRECTINCSFIPGYLIPADLERIALARGFTAEQLEEWAMQELLASPGATVLYRGQRLQIPTLVPDRTVSGACIYLSKDKLCGIHEVAPFGCAFFDSHQGNDYCDDLSAVGLVSIIQDVKVLGAYSRLHERLWSSGRRASSPALLRAKMAAAYRLEEQGAT